jgi:uncharacterized GH25 family protein
MSVAARVAVALALALGLCGPAVAHDFWVQPGSYWPAPQAVTPMTLQVGHGPTRQRSPIAPRRITRFEAVGPGGERLDLRGGLHLGAADGDGDLRFDGPGVYTLVFETDDRGRSVLPAGRFNAHLAAEGLTAALDQRRRTRRMAAEGSESYSRAAKALVQVGGAGAGAQALSIPVGLPLEIVLEASPYARSRGATLPVRVLYQGRPLAGALVRLTDLGHDAGPVESHRTDRTGRASFSASGSGSWLLTTTWSTPSRPSAETDFDTVFSSLSFGVPAVLADGH